MPDSQASPPATSPDLAADLWQQGLQHQLEGRVEEAMQLYRTSLLIQETAEAHTFLGWGLSFQGRLDEAVSECLRAIEADPSLGNPYNDIGAYMVELGRADDALLWFARAKDAPRYETPQFPYLNLARLHMAAGRHGEAMMELQVASVLAPGDARVGQLIERLAEQLGAGSAREDNPRAA
jgi:Tfp pilus assembly protein PilF